MKIGTKPAPLFAIPTRLGAQQIQTAQLTGASWWMQRTKMGNRKEVKRLFACVQYAQRF